MTDSAGRLRRSQLLYAVQFYARDSAGRAAVPVEWMRRARSEAPGLWPFLERHRSEADRVMALVALREDALALNRFVAAMVLANFGNRDSTWTALAEALRDPNPGVREAAEAVLANLPKRRVDWTPAVGTLRIILGGTNVGAMESVFDLLARTEIDPAHASTLLGGNGHWVLAHLRAENLPSHLAARRLLVALNGGGDRRSTAAWRAWIDSLPAPTRARAPIRQFPRGVAP
ncbi:MAG TPA: hypothetical protein VEA99_10265 [Gemmatimonadaceae bacterium]|nr:hypothetical protein [Gemmatimonadaceae bacterium]